MATPAEIHAIKIRQPIFVQAQAVEARMTQVLDRGHPNAARLRDLRSHIRRAISQYNASEMADFLALWRPAFEAEVGPLTDEMDAALFAAEARRAA